MDQVTELISFLKDPRPEARLMAAEGIQGLTGSPDGVQILADHADTLSPALFLRVPDETAISKAALTALVNLSQDEAMAAKLQGNRADLLQLDSKDLMGFNVAVLLEWFTSASPNAGSADPYQYIAMVLMNLTRLKPARQLLLEPGRRFLPALATQLESREVIRRRGCAGAIRNCCFSPEEDGLLQSMLAEKQWLRHVLMRLAGDEAGQDREGDEQAREALAETVLLLAQTEAGRRLLWDLDAPQLLKRGYEYEEHESTCSAMEQTAQLFLQDNGQVHEAVAA
ncbi:hypothetical protein WJX73_000639 [Symbiochloris irregularis]|uniref:Protein HGH1 homolog n=1 Tax=Symbiochloris irregularis TaxID=706552 RepID=A0AAW1PEY9_9CHLO